MKKHIIIALIILSKSLTGIAQKVSSLSGKQILPIVLEQEMQNPKPMTAVKVCSPSTVIKICTPSRSSIINQPLYVVDGEEIASGDSLNIEPKNIESITVLKDESAIKMYGEKAKNGVIIITSKKK
jgi:TonB-dependent SusC/RagA subfamily outer membrane receptor